MSDSNPRLRLEDVFDHATLVRAFNELDANRSGRIGTHESWIDVQDFDLNDSHSVELWEYMTALQTLRRGVGDPFPSLARLSTSAPSWIDHWSYSHKADPNGEQEPSFQELKDEMFQRLLAVGLSGEQIVALALGNKGLNRHRLWETTLTLPAVIETLRKEGYSIENSIAVARGLLHQVPEGVAEAGDQITQHAASVRASLGEAQAVHFFNQVMKLTGSQTGPTLKYIGRRLGGSPSFQVTLTYGAALEAALQVIRTSDPHRAAAFLRGDLASGQEVPASSPASIAVVSRGEGLLDSRERGERLLARMLLMDGHPLRETAETLQEAGVSSDAWTRILVDLGPGQLMGQGGRFFQPVTWKVGVDANRLRDGVGVLKAAGVSADDIVRLARMGPSKFRWATPLVTFLSERGIALAEAVTIAADTVQYAGRHEEEATKAVESLYAHGTRPSDLFGSLKRIIDPAGKKKREPFSQLPTYLEAGYSVAEIESIFAVIEPKRPQSTDRPSLEELLAGGKSERSPILEERYQTVLKRLGWLTGQGWTRSGASSLVTDLCSHSSQDAISVTEGLESAVAELAGPQGNLPQAKIHAALMRIASATGLSTGKALTHLAGAYRALRFLGSPPEPALEQLVRIAEANGPRTAHAYEGLAAVNP